MAFNPANIANAFIEGRQARQQYDYGQTRNAMADLDLQNAPTEIANRNALAGQTQTRNAQSIESGQMNLDQGKAEQAHAILSQALSSGNPKAFVLQNVPVLAQKLKESGIDLASLPDDQANAMISDYARVVAGHAGMEPAKPEAYTLKAGDARYVGDKVIAERAANPDEAAGFTLGKDQRRYGPDGKLIASNDAPGGVDPSQKVDIESKLRNEYTQNSKEFQGVAASFQRIQDSVSDPSPAGDLSLIFNYMKVLDPGSTVREGEFATAQNAGSVDDRVTGLYNRVINGTRLSVDQRQDFLGRATKLYKGQETRHEKTVKARYEGLAKRYGVDPQNVTTDVNAQTQQAAQPPQAPPVTATGPNGQKLILQGGQWVPYGG